MQFEMDVKSQEQVYCESTGCDDGPHPQHPPLN